VRYFIFFTALIWFIKR